MGIVLNATRVHASLPLSGSERVCEGLCSRLASLRWAEGRSVPASLAVLAAACSQRPLSSSPERGSSTAGRKHTCKQCNKVQQCGAYVQQPEPLPRIAARGAVPHQRRERVAVRLDRDALALLPQRMYICIYKYIYLHISIYIYIYIYIYIRVAVRLDRDALALLPRSAAQHVRTFRPVLE